MTRIRHSLAPCAAAIFCLIEPIVNGPFGLWTLGAMAASPAVVRVLPVGAGRPLKLPSQAAAVAAPGDVVRIDPGTYDDCAIWRTSDVVIEAAAPGVVMAGKSCAGQGIFVVLGSDVTIQGITFANATVPGSNGAGIKMLGDNLTVRRSRFLHNENGILAGGSPQSALHIDHSEFIGNGACIEACAHGVYAGAPIRLLEIDNCVFLDTRTAHHIKSRARNTSIRDSRIMDGTTGTASYLIETPNGGNLLVRHNTMEKGPNSSNPSVAISIGTEGVSNPTTSLIIEENQFRSDVPIQTVFVRNSATTPAQLQNNTVSGDVRMLEGPGEVIPPLKSEP